MQKYEYNVRMIKFLETCAKVFLSISIIFLCLVFLFNTYEAGIRSVQQEAIKRKFAHWECNNNGESTFVWNSAQ
jgi:hypothetical protein